MSEWVKPSNRLPPGNKLVLISLKSLGSKKLNHYEVQLGYFSPEKGWDLPNWDGDVTVQHWFEIPLPPSFFGE